MPLFTNRSTAVAVISLLVVGCKPADKDVAPLVDARLRQLGVLPEETTDAGTLVSRIDGGARPAPEDPVRASLRFLAKLEVLMDGYVPPLPTTDDGSGVLRCVTTRSLQQDPALKAAGQKLEAKRQASAKERQKRLRALNALSYRIDYDWATKKRAVAPPYGCCDADGTNCEPWPAGQQACLYEGGLWRAIGQAGADRFLYTDAVEAPTSPPEMMTRLEQAHLEVPVRFSCRIEDVRTERMLTFVPGKTPLDAFVERDVDFTALECSSERGLDVIVRPRGDVGELHAGDVASVPLANVRAPEGVLLKTAGERTVRWTVDAEATSLTVDRAVQCPATEEIVAAAKKK